MAAPSIDRAIGRLRDAGYKLTNARRTVLDVLFESDGHLTSAEVLARVEAHDPGIGRASVFRTLDLLSKLGIVRPTYLEPRTPNYVVLPTDGHHAHIVCTRCHAVIELGECRVGDLIDDLAGQHHVRLTGHLLELYGLCANCAEADRE
jgi:Fur family ferric uptake transcriptional regulator